MDDTTSTGTALDGKEEEKDVRYIKLISDDVIPLMAELLPDVVH